MSEEIFWYPIRLSERETKHPNVPVHTWDGTGWVPENENPNPASTAGVGVVFTTQSGNGTQSVLRPVPPPPPEPNLIQFGTDGGVPETVPA